jgi:hypothetical protein
MTFDTWKEAREHAVTRARTSGLYVAIRKCNEFGKTVFRVTFVSKSDADFHNAEVVKPTDVI